MRRIRPASHDWMRRKLRASQSSAGNRKSWMPRSRCSCETRASQIWCLLTLPRSHGEERRGLLFHVLAPTVGALRIFLVVFVQGKSYFEGLMTIHADIIVDGHGGPPAELLSEIVRPGKADC